MLLIQLLDLLQGLFALLHQVGKQVDQGQRGLLEGLHGIGMRLAVAGLQASKALRQILGMGIAMLATKLAELREAQLRGCLGVRIRPQKGLQDGQIETGEDVHSGRVIPQ